MDQCILKLEPPERMGRWKRGKSVERQMRIGEAEGEATLAAGKRLLVGSNGVEWQERREPL